MLRHRKIFRRHVPTPRVFTPPAGEGHVGRQGPDKARVDRIRVDRFRVDRIRVGNGQPITRPGPSSGRVGGKGVAGEAPGESRTIRLSRSKVPPFWVELGQGPMTGPRLRRASYVLQAMRIPHRHGAGGAVYVPALYRMRAERHVSEYEAELSTIRAVRVFTRANPHAWVSFLAVLPVVLVYLAYTTGVFAERVTSLGLEPNLKSFARVFGFDNVRMLIYHEWDRAITALLMHEDIAHVSANVAFSLFFLAFLSFVTGPGLAVFLTWLAGTLGYVLAVPFCDGPRLAIGFSTALFAIIGNLSGYTVWSPGGAIVWPLAFGAALLGLLGASSETEIFYLGHVTGLIAGMLVGALFGRLFRDSHKVFGLVPQTLFLLAGLAIPVLGAWLRVR